MLAVKFWKTETLNARGLPDEWPSQVIENCEEVPDATWILMTEEEYAYYRESKQDLYNTWTDAQPEPGTHVSINVEDIAEVAKPSFWSRMSSFFGF